MHNLVTKKAIDGIVFSNLWIGIAVGLSILAHSLLVNQTPDWNYILTIAAGTTSSYCFLRFIAIRKHSKETTIESPMLNWIQQYKVSFTVVMLASAVTAAYGIFHLSKEQLILLLIPGLLLLFYAWPSRTKLGLRYIWFLKTPVVAAVWMFTCVAIPMIVHEVNMTGTIITSLAFGSFIWGITIPFDIRDVKFDQTGSLKTIPMVLGVPKTKSLALGLLSLSILLYGCLAFVTTETINWAWLGPLAGVGFASYLVYKTNADKREHWYTFGLDGSIIVYALLSVLTVNLFAS